ncbi:glycosyltransferase [Bacillus sp. FJAT-49705]|uniref:Glycosyltransferase n=1 Tax=Cytobacillus citreus TaxID=2833586 RepID=A0ABS5NR15_9BACI|nr:glycosyltransferase family 2 protein [Cytobacillus citreus]MBS4190260.1 glycosyltransferase [Cytobacillus citreus]
MMEKTITLCMIVKNEEKFLERCLSSVKSKVDEIIIVDTGSTDGTIEIASKFKAKVYNLEWKADFSFARNFSLEKATSDYILVLDADEYLDDSSNLEKVLETEKDHYTVRIKNYLSSGGAIYHPAVRLFKNNRGLQYFGKIHEHLNVEDKSLNLTHEFGDLIINHEGYKDEIVKEKNKHERNIKILLDEVEKNPSGYNYYNLGNQYKSNEELDKALDAYQIAFPLSKDRLYIQYLLYNMIDCLRQLERFEEALNVVDASIESFPNHTDFHFMKGRIYEELNYLQDAEQAYKQCLKLGEVELFQTLEGVGSFLACVRLGSIYIKQGQTLKAFDMAIEAIKFNKYHMPALVMYLEVVQKTRIPFDQVKEHLSSIFPVQNITDLRNLIIVLTVSKSPLLKEYLEMYQVKVDSSVLGISKLYAKEYEEAYEIWSSIEHIEASEVNDLILLSFLLNQNQLLVKCKNKINISSKEWRILNKVVNGEEVEGQHLSNELEEIFLFIIEKLIYMNEEKKFNSIIKILLTFPNSSLKIAELLNRNGLSQAAQNILLEDYNTSANNPLIVELLADTCVKQKQYVEALSFYDRVISLKSKYELYEKVFHVYEELNDKEGMTLVKNEIERKYPLAKWVK